MREMTAAATGTLERIMECLRVRCQIAPNSVTAPGDASALYPGARHGKPILINGGDRVGLLPDHGTGSGREAVS